MANLQKLIDLDGLSYFLGQIKAKFVRSVNGAKPDSKGNVNIANMEGASTSAAGKAGLAPAPTAGAANRYLRSDGTWQIPPDNDTKYSNMTGATASAAGKAGLVPAPAAGKQNKFLCADATWKDAGGLPVGHEFFTTNPNIPAGCIPLLGGEYSRTAYADLWAWVQTQNGYLLEESAWQTKAAANGGNVPFYSKGDGSTTFRVPALKCWVKGASSISEVGSYLEVQYPHMEHYHAFGYNSSSNNGRFIATAETKTYNLPNNGGYRNWNGSGGGGAFNADTDTASQANMITSLSIEVQGNSDTVQPPSIVGLWVVKAYGTVTNVGSTDVANLAQGLANAETRISVLNTLVGAENNGGIVAYLLGKNGYIKFANDLILQWGIGITSTKGANKIAFNIPFTTTPAVFTTNISNVNATSTVNVSEINLTSFYAHAKYGSSYTADNLNWLAIGV